MQRAFREPSSIFTAEDEPIHGVGAPSDAAQSADADIDEFQSGDGAGRHDTDGSVSFDPARLMNMLGGDRERIREVIDLFVADYPIQLDALAKAVKEGDRRRAEHLAHTIRGSSASLGFIRISYAAGRMEEALRQAQTESLASFLDILYEEQVGMSPALTDRIPDARDAG